MPRFERALRVDLGVASRSPNVLPTIVPELGLFGAVGYREYLDISGAVSLGASIVAGTSIPPRDGRDPAGRLSHAGGVVELELRGISDDWFLALVGLYGELGVATWSPDAGVPGVPAASTNLRWAAGVEAGFGLLAWLDPYIFGETPLFLGVESIRLGDTRVQSFVFGGRVAVDFVFRSASTP